MIALLEQHVTAVASPEIIDLDLIAQGIDFSRTYADHCHHGKEENYLFKDLATKPLTVDHRRILDELMEEHAIARAAITAIDVARERALQGDANAFKEIAELVSKLAVLYPAHIEKEDQHFFIPIMGYFTQEEQDNMLVQFAEFDQRLIHEKYRSLVEKLEDSPQVAERNVNKGPVDMSVYECTVCGYKYEPLVGDPTSGIPSGTPFSDLPEDWVCPLCGSGKDLFVRVNE
jgi:hemerythrin-like domain-containing protein/rubredoxin